MTTPLAVWSTSRRDRDTKIGDRTVTVNRLAAATGRGGMVAHVSILVEAIARGDRWAVARRATGPLLEQLLSGDFDDTFGTASESDRSVGLGGAPVVVIDENVAIVVAPVTNSGSGSVGAVTALLIRASTTGTVRPWFVASLTQDQMLHNEFQRRVQHESFPIDADLDIIAAHGPLDARAASIDWDDDSVILRRSDTGVVTVADARAEAATWPRESWHWLTNAADRALRGRTTGGCSPLSTLRRNAIVAFSVTQRSQRRYFRTCPRRRLNALAQKLFQPELGPSYP